MTDFETCHYCRVENRPRPAIASVTVHDKRGCLHVCFEHAIWRSTTSVISGHSPDCTLAPKPLTPTRPMWEPEGWHGFDWSNAARADEEQKRRDISILAHWGPKDITRPCFVLNGDAAQMVGNAAGAVVSTATFNACGDTLILRRWDPDGFDQIWDLCVRRYFHRRMEGCK